MKFPTPLIPATLQQRYKRFLADVTLEDGQSLTVHCPNPGAMMGLKDEGNRVWISDSGNPKRKLRHTLELVEAHGPDGPTLVGINTMMPNRLAEEAITAGRIDALLGYDILRREVAYGEERSRIDILLEHGAEDLEHKARNATKNDTRPCYVEVKNVHLVRTAGLHEFPDCKTDRGAKHLREMASMVSKGARAAMLYVIQRADGDRLSFAADLDPAYHAAFVAARNAGVEAYAIRCDITVEGIDATTPIPIVL
ncbi:MAG: DNA/RNA nuclease SfsA [Pseudomonadota bacterium]